MCFCRERKAEYIRIFFLLSTNFCTKVLNIIFSEYFFSVCIVWFWCFGRLSHSFHIANIFSNFFLNFRHKNAEEITWPDNVLKTFPTLKKGKKNSLILWEVMKISFQKKRTRSKYIRNVVENWKTYYFNLEILLSNINLLDQ